MLTKIMVTTTQSEAERTVEAPRADSNNIPLDEGVWQAWLHKNLEQDRVRSARRVKAFKLVLAILVLTGLYWSLAQIP